MTDIRPIPAELLCDSMTLLIPGRDGELSIDIGNVRIICRQDTDRRTDRARAVEREITAYYDYQQSVPADMGFCCGQFILYDGCRYEITEVREYGVNSRHHCRIKAVSAAV